MGDTKLSAAGPARDIRSRPVLLLIGFWASVAIAIAAVIRRIVELERPDGTGSSFAADMNRTFSSHAALTLWHIIPAGLFVLLATYIILERRQNLLMNRLFYIAGVSRGSPPTP